MDRGAATNRTLNGTRARRSAQSTAVLRATEREVGSATAGPEGPALRPATTPRHPRTAHHRTRRAPWHLAPSPLAPRARTLAPSNPRPLAPSHRFFYTLGTSLLVPPAAGMYVFST